MAGTMHLSRRDSTLYYWVNEGSDPWEGDCDSPTGAFISVSISAEVAEALAEDEDHMAELIGHYILVEDSAGHLYVFKFAPHQRDELLAKTREDYARWLDSEDDEADVTADLEPGVSLIKRVSLVKRAR